MKTFIMWIVKLVALLIAVFLLLIQIDYMWSPHWLSSGGAMIVMGFTIVLYILHALRKSRRRKRKKAVSKNSERQRYEELEEQADRQEVSLHEESAEYPLTKSRVHRNNVPSGKNRRRKRYRRRGYRLRPAVLFVIIAVLVTGGIVVNRMRTPDVPEQVAEMGRKYPEAREYVQNFNKYKNIDFDMDISGEMKEKAIPLFIQWDKRWGYRDYGGNYIGVAGCAPSCLAMVVCGLNQDPDINPYVIATYGAQKGWYTLGLGTSWDMLMRCGDNYGITATRGELTADYIREHLSPDTPMICSMTPGDFTYSGHFIVLTEIDEDGLVTVNDPNSPKNSNKKWDLQTLLSQMKAVWLYQK